MSDGLIDENDVKTIKASFQTYLSEEFTAGASYKPNKADWLDGRWAGFKNNNGDQATGAAGDYLYCIGGDITCADSGDTLVEDTNGGTYTDDNTKSHNSYNSSCSSGSNF